MKNLRNRSELASLFVGEGVELGVAAGAFSKLILKQSKCVRLWSIDRWTDHHDPKEYIEASRMLVQFGRGRCVPLRMTFREALPLFKDGSLDFCYVDGYAAGGQENGQTLEDWWPKLRPGGIFGGHDYDSKWPATQKAVHAFVAKHSLRLHVTGNPDDTGPDQYPSWFVVNNSDGRVVVPEFKHSSPVRINERVILVGNGPGLLLGSARGAEIDAFDQVVRFNWYAIRGFEPFVGTKTTLWSTFGRGTTPRDPDQRPERAVYVHGEDTKQFSLPIKEAFGIARSFFEDVRKRVKNRSTRTGVANDKLLPSSGLVIALWLLEIHEVPLVTLTGFDHFSKEKSGGHYYWLDKKFLPPPEHDGSAETSIFAELRAAGRIAYL